jgi:hypothetical protein
MTVENLIEKINIREQYKAYGLGELKLTDAELKTQLTNLLNTAIADIVNNTNVSGAQFNVKVANGNITVSLSVNGNSVNNYGALTLAVQEYLENEVAYMWWFENEPRYADDSARELLKGIVKSRICAHVNEAIPPKREFKAKETPVTRIEYDYE